MKKILVLFAVILLAACSKNDDNENEGSGGNAIIEENEIEEINRIVANDSIYSEARYPDNSYHYYGIKLYGRKKEMPGL